MEQLIDYTSVELPKMTKDDLERYIRFLYKTGAKLSDDEVGEKTKKQLDTLAVNAIARYYNQ